MFYCEGQFNAFYNFMTKPFTFVARTLGKFAMRNFILAFPHAFVRYWGFIIKLMVDFKNAIF